MGITSAYSVILILILFEETPSKKVIEHVELIDFFLKRQWDDNVGQQQFWKCITVFVTRIALESKHHQLKRCKTTFGGMLRIYFLLVTFPRTCEYVIKFKSN